MPWWLKPKVVLFMMRTHAPERYRCSSLTASAGYTMRCNCWRGHRRKHFARWRGSIATWPQLEVCAHGVDVAELCEECAHHPETEWVGYPMLICDRCIRPWPCDFEKQRREESVKTKKRQR